MIQTIPANPNLKRGATFVENLEVNRSAHQSVLLECEVRHNCTCLTRNQSFNCQPKSGPTHRLYADRDPDSTHP
jgi:hypothetical protein